VPVCPRCDSNEPSLQGLLAFFALHETLSDDTVEEFAALVNEMIHRLPPARTVDPAAFEAELAAWRRGEFDEGPIP
jgi:hypothetical protein